MNRYAVNVSRAGRIVTIVVEASSWESAGRKAEVANRVVTSVRRLACGCDTACDC